MANPEATKLNDRELEFQTVDTANFPYQKMRAGLMWSPTANSGAGGWVKASKLVPESYDYVSNVSAATTDTYTFKTGGSGGTSVATVAVVYTDASKVTISTITKT